MISRFPKQYLEVTRTTTTFQKNCFGGSFSFPWFQDFQKLFWKSWNHGNENDPPKMLICRVIFISMISRFSKHYIQVAIMWGSTLKGGKEQAIQPEQQVNTSIVNVVNSVVYPECGIYKLYVNLAAMVFSENVMCGLSLQYPMLVWCHYISTKCKQCRRV
jgi:hypothetical protein